MFGKNDSRGFGRSRISFLFTGDVFGFSDSRRSREFVGVFGDASISIQERFSLPAREREPRLGNYAANYDLL